MNKTRQTKCGKELTQKTAPAGLATPLQASSHVDIGFGKLLGLTTGLTAGREARIPRMLSTLFGVLNRYRIIFCYVPYVDCDLLQLRIVVCTRAVERRQAPHSVQSQPWSE